MMMKEILRRVTPPVVWSVAARIKSGAARSDAHFEGPFPSWEIAKSRADGWDAPAITDKTLGAARKVRDGLAVAEQDGLETTQIPYSPTMLSFIALAVARHRAVDLIDVGGGLGTHYFHNRKLIAATGLPVRWNVVERSALVEIGAREFQTEELRFFPSTADVPGARDAVIFTGSFQYLADPEATLAGLASPATVLAFDRLLVSPRAADEIYVQHPDPTILYRATYPVRCFSKVGFVDRLAKLGFKLVEQFPTASAAPFDHCGFVFSRA